MPKPERKDIWFDSSDRVNRVAGYIYTRPEVSPFCILQISHGMCEYIGRYEDFADFLTRNGVIVCGNDHIGHGESVAQDGDYGYFTKKNGREYALRDLHTMNALVRSMYPNLPLILLGHSMGSFFARRYAADWPETIDGLIISGTGGPNPMAGFGVGMTRLLAGVKGGRHRSSFVQNVAFGTYLNKIEDPKTKFDWVSRDVNVVRDYVADPKCNFRFTLNGFGELFNALKDVSSPEWAVKLRKDMPVLMISGEADPVGEYGKGPRKVRDWMHDAGVQDITFYMYPDARHEVLNEINKQEVYEDVLAFLRRWQVESRNEAEK